jgi:Fatty acid desaturase
MRAATRGHPDDIAYPSSIGFLLIHVGCLAAVWTGITWRAAAIAAMLYLLRMFAIGAGYHRYFAHRAFSTGRNCQFALAFLAQTSAQRGILWWASKHRRHHRYSDTADDVHSPVQRGLLYAHLGWIFVPRNDATDYPAVRDLARYQELVRINAEAAFQRRQGAPPGYQQARRRLSPPSTRQWRPIAGTHCLWPNRSPTGLDQLADGPAGIQRRHRSGRQ